MLLAAAGLSATMAGNGRQQDQTLGIGHYPGAPEENFAPTLAPDTTTYCNIAKHRSAFASSIHDYNLTAQLLTDGVIETAAPQYLELTVNDTIAPRREREWMFDDGPYSRATLNGSDVDFEITLGNYEISPDSVRLKGNVAYNSNAATGGYRIVCSTSPDGITWHEAGSVAADTLPGKEQRWRRQHSDPNKRTEQLAMAVRNLDIAIPLHTAATSHLRIALDMPGALRWSITACDFTGDNGRIDVKPSQFFTSAWMSSGNDTEWVKVDLGDAPLYDKVILHWLQPAMQGTVQTSPDGFNWTDAATFTKYSSSLTDEIALTPTTDRYLRVAMQKDPDGPAIAMTEMEVMGTGAMTPTVAARPLPTGRRIDLSGGNWQLSRASDDASWIPATVPGTVLTSYQNIGAIPDPNFADNQLSVSESFFNSDFLYRTSFDIPEKMAGERLQLNFDGVNWKADAYVNDHYLGRIDGAFKLGRFDITPYAHKGENTLEVKIIKNSHPGAIKEKNAQSTDFNGGILGADNPTFHASIGWDWIPTIRGRNAGIWNVVYVTSSGPVTLDAPLVTTLLPLPDTTRADVTVSVMAKNCLNRSVTGTLAGKLGDVKFSRQVELQPLEEREISFTPDAFPQLAIDNPRLWWANGYGEPYLYDAEVAFEVDGELSDSIPFKAGLRQMTYDETDGVLNIYLNGRRFIGRGGNWGFSESNLNYRQREYDIAVAYHKDMNMNIIRNWVGMTGDEEFYDACDRNGIMVWQDFWLANPSDGPDPYYPEMFIDNADDYLKRIRSHASLGIYCGRNEGFPPARIDSALRVLVDSLHPGMHYIGSSADGVVTGHGPYRMLPAKQYFTMKEGSNKFHSERGMPNVLTYESMLRTFSPEGLWPQADQWGMHDYTREGAQGATSFNEIIAQGYGTPQSAKEFSELAQWVNYDGHRSMFESRSNHRQGLLMWMSHSCWPSMVWQTYDYFFEPTAAYFAIKKASEPLHIQWNPASDSIEVVNYSAGSRPGLTATARLHSIDGTEVWSKQAIVDSDDDSTIKCFAMNYPDDISTVHFIELTLTEGTDTISRNFYHRSTKPNDFTQLRSLPEASVAATFTPMECSDGKWTAKATLRNDSPTPALMLRLNLVGAGDGEQILPVTYSDNYISLLPGQSTTVTISWDERDARGNEPKLKLSGYNAALQEL